MMGKRPSGELPPVTVSCTADECGHQFLSRAARHTVVRCPRCKRAVRVKRARPFGWQRKPAARPPRAEAAREAVCAENHAPAKSARPGPRPVTPVPAPDHDHADDDGWAYMPDAAGNLILADLTPEGQLVPIRLIDQRFRAITPGTCYVYGCTNPARWMFDGFPVCPECRRDLGGIAS